MALRKLLVVTYHFPPSAASGSFRLLGFARHLPRFGWQPVVVAPPCLPSEPVDEELGKQIPPEAILYPVPYPRLGRFRLARRLAPKAVWLPRALAACARAIRREQPHALLTSSPPHCVQLLGLFLKHRYGLPWLADFRDPWVIGDPVRGHPSAPWRWARRGERAVLEAADRVLANTPRAAAVLQAAYPRQSDKVVTLPNGYDPEKFNVSVPAASPDGALQIFHAGELYAGRDPRPLLDAMQVLRLQPDCPRFRLYLVGRGDRNLDIQAEVHRRALDEQVRLGGQLPHGQVLEEMMRSDILLLLDYPGRPVGVPAKLYEYLGAGRPILALADADGDVAWVLRRSGLPYRIAPPRDPDRIRQALVELAHERKHWTPGAANRQAALQFSRQATARTLATLLDRCTEPARAALRLATDEGRTPQGRPRPPALQPGA